MKFEIRNLKEEDIEEIIKLKSMLFNFHVKIDKKYTPNKNFKQMYMDHIQIALASEGNKFFVAEHDNKIIGFIEGCISVNSEFFRENVFGSVTEIFVKEEYREKGIAKKLLEYSIKWFKSKKIKTIGVVVDSRNKKAIKTWEHLGFVELQKKMELSIS